MRRFLLAIVFLLGVLIQVVSAQPQTVNNGAATQAITFPGAGCTYNWINNHPEIGLAASGSGNIASFTAVNNGSTAITATITATPVSNGYAYIAGSNNPGTVTAINTQTNTIAATINVGNGPESVWANPNGLSVYVINTVSNNVSVISTATNTVTTSIPVGNAPQQGCMSYDGSTFYVGNFNDNSVSVISTATNTVTKVVTGIKQPSALAADPAGALVYVASLDGIITVINTATNTVQTTFTVPVVPWQLTLSPDGSKLYITTESGNSVLVFNTSTKAVLATIPVATTPQGEVLSADGSLLYVGCFGAEEVDVINTTTNAVVKQITTGSPLGLSLTADGKFLYVANNFQSTVSIYNTATGGSVTSLPVGANPNSFGSFISSGTSCPTATFTIIVNPSPAPVITAGAVTGAITACAGTASVSPQIQQFTVSGSNLTAGITATAPTNFEVSLTVGSGYSTSVTIPQIGGIVANTIVYVRSSASANTGNISGNVVLASGAGTQNVAVNGVVNALPTVNTIPNQIWTNGQTTAAINFAGTGTAFIWTNDTPVIGLAANGTGSIGSFTAVNTGSSPVTANITVTALNAGLGYITNSLSASVSVINLLNNTVVKTIPVGMTPLGVAISPDEKFVYVTNSGDGTVSVINAVTNTVTATIPAGAFPVGIAVDKTGMLLYVANGSTSSVSVINISSQAITATIPVGTSPWGLALTPDGDFLYVASQAPSTISVISTATNNVIKAIPSQGFGAYCVTISPDGKWVYVSDYNSYTITVLSTATNTVSALIKVHAYPVGMVVTPDGGTIYVATQDNFIDIINSFTNTVTSSISIFDGAPEGISITPDGRYVYITNLSSYKVSVIDTKTNLETGTVTVGSSPTSFGNFISNGSGCAGPPTTFTITVNPTPAALPVITASPVTGSISACAGTASASPQLQQVTISGSNLTDNITATVPSVFEISSSPNSGFGSSVVLQQTGGTVNATTLYIRSNALAPVGTSSGYVTLSSTGWISTGQGPAITETINALPTVNQVQNQVWNNGQTTTAVNFTGTGATFNWTNSAPSIGLAASGIGNIASFKAVNVGSSPVVATITVDPLPKVLAYLANESSNTVSVIDIETNSVIGTVTVGTAPFGVAVSPNGSQVYVGNTTSNSVSVINTASNAVTATITGIGQPFGIAVSPDGSKVYVAENSASAVAVINAATNAILTTIPVDVSPYGIAISPDGSRVYVATVVSGKVAVINAITNTLITTIKVGSNPVGVSISSDGSMVYVANGFSNSISVISTATNTVVATVGVGQGPVSITVSKNGGYAYVINQESNNVTVINTATNTVLTTIAVGLLPFGASLSPDGNYLYVTDEASNAVSVINTLTNTVIAALPVGTNPDSFGNFIMESTGCAGTSSTFTITVDPTPAPTPIITATQPTGTITACQGTASASPNIQQFTVSGSNLSADITLTAPVDFELSLSAGSGYASNLTLTQTGGAVSNTVIYVRSAASAPAQQLSEVVAVASTGANSQFEQVSGTINATPTVGAVNPQSFVNAVATPPINFTGTGTSYAWTNSNPSIGLPANGTGNIASFTPVNTGVTPVTAQIAVTAQNSNSTCPGIPVNFTVTVNPTPIASINATGTLSPLSTIYGTPSVSESFMVSGSNLTDVILVDPPIGFELSTDNATFSHIVTVGSGSGSVPTTPVYIRLAAITPVGPYSGNIQLTSAGVPNAGIMMPVSTVTPAQLAIVADDKTKLFDTPNPVLTAAYVGFVNNETSAVLISPAILSTTALLTSPVGQYPITISGAASPNYIINTFPGTLTVVPSQLVIPNTFTPNGDGVNDTWNISYLNNYNGASVDIFTRWGQKVFSSIGYGTPWDGTYNGAALPVGTYYYIINLKNGTTPLSGFVALLR